MISDLHANDEALKSVLRRVRRKRIDRVICLGDVVGYGAQPNQVLDRLRRLRRARTFIRGNHDRVAAGVDDGERFNDVAREAALWTRGKLSGVNASFIRSFEVGPVIEGDLTMCHGSPDDEDQYLVNVSDAAAVLSRPQASWITLFGHTHLPSVFEQDPSGATSGTLVRGQAKVSLDRNCHYLINPGSVGQPRDRNSEASFALLDTDAATVRFIRVEYDIQETQRAIRQAGLPEVLAMRLEHGS